MLHITLVCMGGFSTGMLVKRMREDATKQGIEVDINATSESNFKNVADKTDVLLIGPQVSFIEATMRSRYPEMKIAVINAVDYGTMNGSKVLDFARNM